MAKIEDVSLEQGDNPIPRIRMGEIGSTGLYVSNGKVYEEARKELQHPQWNKIVKQMMIDPVVAAGVEIYKMWLSRAEIDIVPFDDTADSVQKAMFVKQCIHDMDHSFEEFLSDVFTYIEYGHAPIEMVFKKRLTELGSRYNDGLIGLRKLPIRSQDTVEWKFTDDGRDVDYLEQDLNGINPTERYNLLLSQNPLGKIKIPAAKIANFRYKPTRANPYGSSPLKAAYQAWKYRTQMELDEAIGIQRNMNGVPVYYMPPEYMSPDATDDRKATFAEVKRQIANYAKNEQSGFVIPNIFDPVAKQRLFELEPLEIKGSSAYDTNAIIRRWDLKILTTLLADVLTLGQEGNGSFALSENKTALMQMSLEARLKEISTVFNNRIIKTLFELNGWNSASLPSIKFEYPTDVETDNFGKLIQRVGAVNFIPRTPSTVAWIMQQAGYPNWQEFQNMTQEEVDELFTENETGAGEGMESGMNSGTGKANKSNSATNSDNAA